MTNAKYGFQFCRDGRWFTARGIGTWEELRAEFLEHYPDALVRVLATFSPGVPIAYEGPGRAIPDSPPQLPTRPADPQGLGAWGVERVGMTMGDVIVFAVFGKGDTFLDWYFSRSLAEARSSDVLACSLDWATKLAAG